MLYDTFELYSIMQIYLKFHGNYSTGCSCVSDYCLHKFRGEQEYLTHTYLQLFFTVSMQKWLITTQVTYLNKNNYITVILYMMSLNI